MITRRIPPTFIDLTAALIPAITYAEWSHATYKTSLGQGITYTKYQTKRNQKILRLCDAMKSI